MFAGDRESMNRQHQGVKIPWRVPGWMQIWKKNNKENINDYPTKLLSNFETYF